MRQLLLVVLIIVLTCSIYAQDVSLTLEECIQIALKNNATIITNENLNKSSEKDVLASYAGILPTLNASASSGKFEAGESEDFRDVPVAFDSLGNPTRLERRLILQPSFQVNFNQLNLRLNQNLFDGGEWWNAIRYAKAQKRASDYDLTGGKPRVFLQRPLCQHGRTVLLRVRGAPTTCAATDSYANADVLPVDTRATQPPDRNARAR